MEKNPSPCFFPVGTVLSRMVMSTYGGCLLVFGDKKGYYTYFSSIDKAIVVCRIEYVAQGLTESDDSYMVTEIIYHGPDNPRVSFFQEIIDHIPIEEVAILAADPDDDIKAAALKRLER